MCSPQQGWQAESPRLQQNPREMQGPRKTPQNRQQTTSTSSSCNVKWLDLGSIMWFKNGFSFSSDCFLSTELRKFFSQGLQLGQQKETKIILCSSASKWKVIHTRTWTGEDKKLKVINPSWVLAMSLSSSLHGVAHPSMQKKTIYAEYKVLGRGYMERQLWAGVTGWFFSVSLCIIIPKTV